MRYWRISNYADLSGLGAKHVASRWNSGGLPMVYLADHPSTALLETIVHFDRTMLPSTFQLLAIDAPGIVAIDDSPPPPAWQDDVKATQNHGQEFLAAGKSCLLRVPSVIMPQAFNYLLNPAHREAALFSITQVWRYPFDSRLLD